jgi:hypothetical protein
MVDVMWVPRSRPALRISCLGEERSENRIAPRFARRQNGATDGLRAAYRAEEEAMRWWTVSIGVLMFGCGMATASLRPAPVGAQGVTVVMDCGTSAPQVRTTLYFGLTRPKGAVSELEWQLFVRDEITHRFPEGLTVWDADGQWRTPAGSIDHERSKVLLLVHADTADARRLVQELIERYRKMFDQQSVLWESSRACVTT